MDKEKLKLEKKGKVPGVEEISVETIGFSTEVAEKDIKDFQTKFKELGKEIMGIGAERQELNKITRQAIECRKELDKIEEEMENKACEVMLDFFAKNPEIPKEDIEEGVDRVLKPLLTKVGEKFKDFVSREKLKKIARSIRRKVILLTTFAIAFEAGLATAEEAKKEQQIDNAALGAVPESLVNVDADTTTLAAQKALDNGVITEEELKKFTPETKAKPKYKYPKDGQYIDTWLEKLAKVKTPEDIQFITEFLESEVYSYNANHPDDPQDVQELLGSVSSEARELNVERVKTELPEAIHTAREKFRTEIRAHRLRCKSGSKNIVKLMMAMETAAKNGDWEKVKALWDTRADYYPPVVGDMTEVSRNFEEYDSILEPVGDLIDLLP